ncbi:MAG: hypothetical protein OHK0029_06280 [Armatimonadaceae bacterium]
MITMNDFDTAVRVFRARPCLDTLNLMTLAGRQVLMDGQRAGILPGFEWCRVPGPFVPEDFQEIRLVFDRELSGDELRRASGCLGYALRIYLGGEDLSEPTVVSLPGQPTVALYRYDSTKAIRSEPDIAEAVCVARHYLEEGTPVRTTNRAGEGTRGTRLVDGLGPVRVDFAVR